MTKVAVYCRVSTDLADQVNSFEAQQRYFRDYIERTPDWELYKIYADQGITGTNTHKREQFNHMIADARNGCFQLILTKEVSRFSRNLLDAISYTRELKVLGIAVLFVNDGINTLEPDAELRLSIMASIAQEESRKTSSRITWGQTRQMEQGVVFGHSLLGYDVRNGSISVNPDGARTVRMIFQKYALEQINTAEIVRYLNHTGCKTGSGSTKWTAAAVHKILKNEKYMGDLVQRKTYTPDYLTHKKQKNQGEVPLIRIENHHEPIVSREIWNLAQKRRKKNFKQTEGERGHSNYYVFSGKIKCGECGACFVCRTKYRKDGTAVRRWCCATAVRGGREACNVGKLVRDDDAMRMLKIVLKNLQIDTLSITSHITALAVDVICNNLYDDSEQLRHKIDRMQKKKETVLDSYFSQDISKADMLAMNQIYDKQINLLRQQMNHVVSGKSEFQDLHLLKSEIESKTAHILNGETDSDVFYKAILHSLTVFKDRHMELKLNHLPHVFYFEG